MTRSNHEDVWGFEWGLLMTKGLPRGFFAELLSLADAPKILRTASASQPLQFAHYSSVQNALGTQHSNERQVRPSDSQKTMTLHGSSEGENGALKPYIQAKDLLVLGARALIDIGRIKLSVPERETGGILLFPRLSVKQISHEPCSEAGPAGFIALRAILKLF